MATRVPIKKVDAEKMASGVYHATFTDEAKTVVAFDLRQLPTAFEDVDGKRVVTTRLGNAYDDLPEIVRRTLQYGIKQKLDDSMAGAETIAEAIDELKSTAEAILNGNWTVRVPGEGVEGGLFARAYAERHGIPLSDAKAKIAALVERNHAAAVAKEAAKPEAERKEVTERMILNAIRDVARERDPALDAIYKALQEKRAKKPAANRPEIDLSDE